MVDQIAAVSFTTPGVTGNFDITSPAITEACKAAIVFYGNSTNDDTNESPGRMGLALLALENSVNTGGTMSALLRNGLAAPQCRNGHLDQAGIQLCRNNGTVTNFDVVADSPSAVTGGLRLNFTNVTQQITGHVILFAGASMRAWGGQIQATTSSQHQNAGPTSPSDTRFQPDIVFLMGAKEGAINAGQSLDCVVGFGAALSGGAQKGVSVNIDNLTEPSDADGEIRSAQGIPGLSTTRTSERVTITIDSTGFNYISNSGTPRFYFLAIKFGSNVRLGVANMAVAASGGNQSFNDFGFTPDVVIGQASLLTTEDTLTDGATASCAGLFSFMARGGHQRAYTVALLNGNSGTSAAGGQQSASALLLVDDTGTLVQKASYVGASGSGGYVLNFSTASAAGMVTAVGIQIVPNPPPAPAAEARAGSSVRAHRHRPLSPSGHRPAPIISRVLAEVARFRRAALARIRWKPPLEGFQLVVTATELEEPPKGKIASPGLLRGRIVAALEDATAAESPPRGRISAPGLVRGKVAGATVKQPEV